MIYTPKITNDIQINSLKDLIKLKPLLEDGTLKINKSQIARELGKDRRTVDKYLKGYERSTTRKRSSCIDDYYDIIKELLSDENQQIFYYKRVLWQFLKDNHGLSCAQSSFRRYISQHSESQSYFERRQKRHMKKRSHIRFETPPGKQAQLDWKESMKFLLKSGEWVDINILKVNPRFAQFASDYGFKVRPCIAARPQTKAKVEAPMKLLDELYAYNGLLDYHELNQLVHKLNERINHKVHPGTGRIPVMYLQKEKAHLSQLPRNVIRKPYQMIHTTVKVNSSCMITYRSNQYSVPPKYLGKRLVLQVYDNYLYVYYNTELVVIHPVSSKKLNYIQEHYVAVTKQTFQDQTMDIEKIAKENLTQIGAMFKNE